MARRVWIEATEIDVDHPVAKARETTRRRNGVVGALVCVIVAVSVLAVVARASGDSSSPVVRAEPPVSSAPDGWTKLEFPGFGDEPLWIELPPGWRTFSRVGPLTGSAVVALRAGTTEPGVDGTVTACLAGASTPAVTGTWLSIFEYPPSALGHDVQAPSGGGTFGAAFFASRPEDFTDPANPGLGSACPGSDSSGPTSTNAFAEYGFVEHGRMFFVSIVTTELVDGTGMNLARRALNTLLVTPPATGTSATPSVTSSSSTNSTLPGPTITTPPSPPLSTTARDETAIVNAFEQWIYVSPRDAIEPYVEDAASILDAWRQGIAQQPSPGPYDKYRIRVDSVDVVDDTHADVVYTLLFDGRPQFDHVPAKAIKIDGTWKVTRETVCAILRYGSITCPPRS